MQNCNKNILVPFSCVPEGLHFFWLRGQLVHYGKQEETLGQLLLRRETCRSLGFRCEAGCLDIFIVCVNWLLSVKANWWATSELWDFGQGKNQEELVETKSWHFPSLKGILVFTEIFTLGKKIKLSSPTNRTNPFYLGSMWQMWIEIMQKSRIDRISVNQTNSAVAMSTLEKINSATT